MCVCVRERVEMGEAQREGQSRRRECVIKREHTSADGAERSRKMRTGAAIATGGTEGLLETFAQTEQRGLKPEGRRSQIKGRPPRQGQTPCGLL